MATLTKQYEQINKKILSIFALILRFHDLHEMLISQANDAFEQLQSIFPIQREEKRKGDPAHSSTAPQGRRRRPASSAE